LKNTIEPVKEEEQYLLWDIEVHKKKATHSRIAFLLLARIKYS